MSSIRGSVLVARFGGYRTITTSSLWQYDYGQTLKFEGLTLPEAYEVHFSKSDSVGTAITQIGNAEGVTIPDMMLLKPGPIYVWIYSHEGSDDGETEYKLTIPVNARVRPSDDEPTPVEQSTITEAIAALNVAVEETAADALRAEGYALGSQNGEPLDSTSPYFEANAKWFKEKAEDARDLSVSAKEASESARDSSISAKEASVSAADRSEAARDASISAKNDSVSAKNASESAFIAAEVAMQAAEEFQNEALSAKTDAVAAKNESVLAKNTSVSAKNEAIAAKEAALNAKEDTITAKEAAEGARDEILGFDVTVETLPAGSSATASYDSGIMSLGIPRGDKGAKGDTGATGQTGATGPKGDKGEGVVAGGSPGQILMKKSGTDYDTEWADMIHPVQFHICTAGEYMASTKMPIIPKPDPTTFYLVPDGTGNDVFIEWINLGGTWEKLGSTRIDLTNYIQKTDIATASVPGLVKPNASYGTRMGDSPFQNTIMVVKADDSEVKSGSGNFKPIVPSNEHAATFFGLAKAAGDTTQAESDNPIGTYTDGAKTAIKEMIGVEDPTVSDVQINGSSIVEDGVANIPKTDEGTFGVVKVMATLGIGAIDGVLYVKDATSDLIKGGTNAGGTIKPKRQHEAVFYGLSKVAGVDLANETVTLGTYPETSKSAIKNMIGVVEPPVTDVQVNGTSIIDANGVANVPVANSSTLGVGMPSNNGIQINAQGKYVTKRAMSAEVKSGSQDYNVITPTNQHESTFYGLAKAAGVNMASSGNPVGTYTDAAKVAIQKMLGIHPVGDFEEIARYAVAENSDLVTVNTDINGLPFKAVHAMITIKLVTPTTGTNDYLIASFYDQDGVSCRMPTLRWLSNILDNTWFVYQFNSYNGMAVVYGKASATGNAQSCQMSTYTYISDGHPMYRKIDYMTGVQFRKYGASTSQIPAGSEIVIYGCRVLE